MHRTLVCFSRILIAAFAVAISSQAADAQLYGGSCCGQGYDYGYASSYPISTMGYGYSPAIPAYYGYPSTIGYGVAPYAYGGYGVSSGCGTGCGLFGHFRRRRAAAYCVTACDYPSYYQTGYSAVYVRPRRAARLFGCRPHSYTYACGTVACALPSPIYTGAIATCCTPVASTCADASFSSYPIETGYSSSMPASVISTPALSPSATATPAPAPTPETNPLPPKEPATAPAPEPGT